MENYILPKIVDAGGDLSARWFVEYKYKHPETNKYIKFREWISAKLLTRSARYVKATEMKNTLSVKLKSGYNPFENLQKNQTLVQVFEEVLKIKEAINGKRTKIAYTSTSNIFLRWIKEKKYDNIRPCEFNKRIAQEFLDYVLLIRKTSNRTHNNYLATLRTLFECFFDRDYIDVNVWKKIKRLPVKETSLSFYNKEDRKEITDFLPKEHYQLYCVALLIYYCYLRPAEIVRLKICDFDFEKKQIIVKGIQSKNGKTQIVVMHDNLIESLKLLEMGNYPFDYNVFATSKGLLPSPNEIAPTRIADAWRWYVKEKHGIKKNIYDFKPSGISEALEGGIHTREIQLQIRHHSLEQTQIYCDKISNTAGQLFRDKMPSF